MILQITFEKNNNSTIIKNINSLPVINYYDQKFENFKLVPIDKYNEKLEKSHNRYSKVICRIIETLYALANSGVALVT